MLRLYNTLTRKKEEFRPLDPANVRMYVCGPTVYDFAHIGNARPVIVFDVLYRLLRHIYGPEHVTYVRNITDVDDKINARAAQDYPELPLNEAIRRVTEKTEKQFHEDMGALGTLGPNVEPRATKHIAEMKVMIERLVENGCAYVAEDHVLFHVAAMKDYGKLSGRSIDEMIAGARVEVAPFKKDPMDFVLWKPSKPGEPSWPSPCGIKAPGRPGWHIECSAMSAAHLGETFDIHGGGIDLVFPHHENEIAQSRCANRTKFMAQVWMHNGFLQVEGEKMAKSLGNFVTVHELLETRNFGGNRWLGEILRLNMLRTHYRQPLDWTAKGLEESREILASWEDLVANVDRKTAATTPTERVTSALCDDLNTPEVISLLHDLAKERQNQALYANLVFLGVLPNELEIARGDATEIKKKVRLPEGADEETIRIFTPQIEAELDERSYGVTPSANTTTMSSTTFSIITSSNNMPTFLTSWTKHHPGFLSSRDKVYVRDTIGIETLNEEIAKRLAARELKNFREADRIRDELAAMGIALKDAKDPNTGELVTTWEVAR